MAVKRRKPAEEHPTPHYESSTQEPFTGVPIGAKRAAGVMRDGEHARPGGWVPGYQPNEQIELPKPKKAEENR